AWRASRSPCWRGRPGRSRGPSERGPVASWCSSFRRRDSGDAEADHVDAAAIFFAVFALPSVLHVGVDQAAQRQRARAELSRQRKRFRLAGRELEGGGLADNHALAVLLLDRLVDGEHANVAQDDLAGVDVDSGALLGLAVAPAEDDVDVIIGQDEP